MPFYYNPGGGSNKIDIGAELSYGYRGENPDAHWGQTVQFENYYKGDNLHKRTEYDVTNWSLDRAVGNTGFKVNGVDVGNSMTARVIIFQPPVHRNSITHNWDSGIWANYYNRSENKFSNTFEGWINIGNVYNRVAVVCQGAGGGGGYSNTSNGNGWGGGGGGGGAMTMSGIQNVTNHWVSRSFYVKAGAGGRSGTHWKYAGNDRAPQGGTGSTVYYYFPGGSWDYYVHAGGGAAAYDNHYAGGGGSGSGNGAWGGWWGGGSGQSGDHGAAWAPYGGNAGGSHHHRTNNGNSHSWHTSQYNYRAGGPHGYNGTNNWPGHVGGGDRNNWNWNFHGGPVTFNREAGAAGGGGGGAGGNNKGNGRPGKPGGNGADGYVAMFLYL